MLFVVALSRSHGRRAIRFHIGNDWCYRAHSKLYYLSSYATVVQWACNHTEATTAAARSITARSKVFHRDARPAEYVNCIKKPLHAGEGMVLDS